MKTKHISVSLFGLLSLTVVMLSLQSCAEDMNSIDNRYDEYARPEDRFDYHTSEFVPIDLSAPANSYVALYERDPRQYPEAMPFFSTIIDNKGHFADKVDVPQHLIGEQIYVNINGQVATAILGANGISMTAASRSGTNGTLSSDEMEFTTNTLIKQYFDKLMIKNNDNTKLIDTSAAGVDITTIADNTEVLFSLVNLTGRFMLQLYYYYYPAERTSPGQSNFQDENKMAEFIKRFMRPEFCLTRNWQNSYTGYNSFAAGDLHEDETGAFIGEGASGWINRNFRDFLNQKATTVKLKYYGWFDKLGEFTNIDNPTYGFPADYKIGFFMYVAVPETDWWVKPTDSAVDCNETYYNDINKNRQALYRIHRPHHQL